MAQRRMFSKDITENDAFLDMPLSTQALYFHLGMQADDDGFVSPNRIIRMLGCQADDLKILVAKKFVLQFEDGVLILKHWRMNNFIRKDLYKQTPYKNHRKKLYIRKNGSYSLKSEDAIPLPEGHFQIENMHVDDTLTTRQPSIDKISIDKISIEKRIESRLTPPTLSEIQSEITTKGLLVDAETFHSFYESNGWRVGKNQMKNWKAALLTWHRKNKPKENRLKQIHDAIKKHLAEAKTKEEYEQRRWYWFNETDYVSMEAVLVELSSFTDDNWIQTDQFTPNTKKFLKQKFQYETL